MLLWSLESSRGDRAHPGHGMVPRDQCCHLGGTQEGPGRLSGGGDIYAEWDRKERHRFFGGGKERAQGRSGGEERAGTGQDAGEGDKGPPNAAHCLTGVGNRRPVAQGCFLPAPTQAPEHLQEPRGGHSEKTSKPRVQVEDKGVSRSLSFLMCKFNETQDPSYALWFSAAGGRRRDPASEKQLAKHRAAHTFGHLKKSFVDQVFLPSSVRQSSARSGLWQRRKDESLLS